ncbi:golgi uridine diphosphate-N- acetylglucosamine transporter [Tilletia horrida]|nr:golgi uridine diphosphate-N- acetylglucosamine transporter [Tilletia horrida]
MPTTTTTTSRNGDKGEGDALSAKTPHATRSTGTSIALVLFASQWPLILGLIFGGCCSNAYFLELGTAAVPRAGTLITFAQFLATALTCIPSQLEWPSSDSSDREGGSPSAKRRRSLTMLQRLRLPRLKTPKVPVSRWSVQVLLYLTTSLLNNAAFAYDIPMSVHIVFRSGGLVINMILGWAVEGRRYNPMQIFSVIIVTVGVVAATLFAQAPLPSSAASASASSSSLLDQLSPTYIFGVSLLLLALILSGLMGLYQERTFRTYGRDNWQEALFYAHTLSLPIFLARWRKLRGEIRLADSTPPVWIAWLGAEHVATSLLRSGGMTELPFVDSNAGTLDLGTGCRLSRVPHSRIFYSSGPTFSSCGTNAAFSALTSGASSASSGPWSLATWSLDASKASSGGLSASLTMPSFWPVLLLNVLTQLLCINGVNRLTSQVTSLTVTLVLVLRKATSLAISVVLVGGRRGNVGLWSGAGAVLLGTVGYTLASAGGVPKASRKEQEKGVRAAAVAAAAVGGTGGDATLDQLDNSSAVHTTGLAARAQDGESRRRSTRRP